MSKWIIVVLLLIASIITMAGFPPSNLVLSVFYVVLALYFATFGVGEEEGED